MLQQRRIIISMKKRTRSYLLKFANTSKGDLTNNQQATANGKCKNRWPKHFMIKRAKDIGVGLQFHVPPLYQISYAKTIF
jgi:hypothetical protein